MKKPDQVTYKCDACGKEASAKSDYEMPLEWRKISASNINYKPDAADVYKHACSVGCERKVLANMAGAEFDPAALDRELVLRGNHNSVEAKERGEHVARLQAELARQREVYMQADRALEYANLRDAVTVGVDEGVKALKRSIKVHFPRWLVGDP